MQHSLPKTLKEELMGTSNEKPNANPYFLFNGTITLMDHFVLSPGEKEKWYRRAGKEEEGEKYMRVREKWITFQKQKKY